MTEDINNYRKVVHAIFWNRKNQILLSKRLKNGYHYGFYGDVGGKMEPDETPIDALVRETKEEIGLRLNAPFFKFIDCFIYQKRQLKTFVFESFLTDSYVKKIKNIEPNKHQEWKWFTKEQALKLKLMPSVFYYLTLHRK